MIVNKFCNCFLKVGLSHVAAPPRPSTRESRPARARVPSPCRAAPWPLPAVACVARSSTKSSSLFSGSIRHVRCAAKSPEVKFPSRCANSWRLLFGTHPLWSVWARANDGAAATPRVSAGAGGGRGARAREQRIGRRRLSCDGCVGGG